jgi:hypothetical protein
LRSSYDGWLGWNVVVPSAGLWINQNSAVEHPSDNDRDRALLAERQQLVHRHLIKQRVSTSDEKNIEVTRLDKSR